MNAAVRKLNHDLSHLQKAKTAESNAKTAEQTAVSNEKTALASIQAQEAQVVDQFTSGQISSAQEQAMLQQLQTSGVSTQDTFTHHINKDKKTVAHDKKTVAKDRKQALRDLKPAEYELGLGATNRDREELGLKPVNKVIRSPLLTGMAKAVKLGLKAVHLEASQGCYDYTENVNGPRTNYGMGPLTKQRDGRISFDCSGFVGSVYRSAGLPSPYTVGYGGTSFDVAGCRNMVQVSERNAKPGDVVVFPGHIALYIGGGKCISMGEQGEPKVMTVAAEAAYHNRGISGFYAPRGS